MYLKQRATPSRFRRFNRHDFCLGRKNVGLLKDSNLAIFSCMRHRDYTSILKMSAGPAFPRYLQEWFTWLMTKHLHVERVILLPRVMLPVQQKSFYLNAALTPWIQMANIRRNDDRSKIWALPSLEDCFGVRVKVGAMTPAWLHPMVPGWELSSPGGFQQNQDLWIPPTLLIQWPNNGEMKNRWMSGSRWDLRNVLVMPSGIIQL